MIAVDTNLLVRILTNDDPIQARRAVKNWVNRAKSFEEAQDFDNVYYLSLSSTERVESVQFVREDFFKSHGLKFREDGKRLRRVFRIIKQA